ncbi:Maleate isomerase [Chelatococcus asaccharovorans]|uniref:Maleate isomerase n=2 Tax=Chelatococcus asaccharovorans TaxID=28210 RepID=A0A2V3U7E1_9HYPH|nr:maleate isomerase [Chelatococcus asaccharovorans]CAH1653273.1 Maleate isomerase [Chelatococcus asaccharovorans]CAH1686093.1 Maleate isomerase [Chelatococcus asaccharovorans]
MGRGAFRIGQIVPSSNTTMETEVPEFLRSYAAARGDVSFTFHSSRMRMKHVRKEELAAMDADSHRCARELADAPIDVAGYACLVAIMAMGLGYHRESEETLARIAAAEGRAFPVVTSAGALVSELRRAGGRKVALLMPYTDSLAEIVVRYIANEGIEVAGYKNFSVADNQEVGRIPGSRLLDALKDLPVESVDAVVLSACVQMPSLDVLQEARRLTGKPVTSTAECTSFAMLRALGLAAPQSHEVAA